MNVNPVLKALIVKGISTHWRQPRCLYTSKWKIYMNGLHSGINKYINSSGTKLDCHYIMTRNEES